MEGLLVARRPLHWRIVWAERMLSLFSHLFLCVPLSYFFPDVSQKSDRVPPTPTPPPHSLLQSAFSLWKSVLRYVKLNFFPFTLCVSLRLGCVSMTLFKRASFRQNRLFPLPLTELYCIRRTKHNICCQLMYAVMDINVSAVRIFHIERLHVQHMQKILTERNDIYFF